MIYLSNEPYPQEISVPRSFGVIVPQRNTYLSTADIAADLTTDSDTKVLAASQGVALKAMVAAKADKSNTYTKAQVNSALALKADKSNTYTKAQVDEALAEKADVTDIPTKTSDLTNDSGFVTGQEVSQTYETKSDATAKETALQNAINTKQDILTFDNVPTNGSSNPVKSDGIYDALATKQPTISDLQTIRSGAAAGATAVQPAELSAGLATKQDTINDLATIRSGAAAGATAVQPSQMQAALEAKQDTLVSGTNIKTVNGENILGSGNIVAGDPNAVKYTEQTLTDAQKTQARTNIEAASNEQVSQLEAKLYDETPQDLTDVKGGYITGPPYSWYGVSAGLTKHLVIPCAPGETIQVKGNATVASIYTWLKTYNTDSAPDLCSGASLVTMGLGEETSIVAPADATYLYFTIKTSGLQDRTPQSVNKQVLYFDELGERIDEMGERLDEMGDDAPMLEGKILAINNKIAGIDVDITDDIVYTDGKVWNSALALVTLSSAYRAAVIDVSQYVGATLKVFTYGGNTGYQGFKLDDGTLYQVELIPSAGYNKQREFIIPSRAVSFYYSYATSVGITQKVQFVLSSIADDTIYQAEGGEVGEYNDVKSNLRKIALFKSIFDKGAVAVDNYNRVVVSFNGDSIIGSQLDDITPSPEYDTGAYPPNLSKMIMARQFFDKYRFSGEDVVFRNLEHSDWVKTGFNANQGKQNAFFNKFEWYGCASAEDSAQISVTGHKYFKLVWSRKDSLTAPWTCSVLVSVDGGAFVSPSQAGISLPDSFGTASGHEEVQVYAICELNPAKTYVFKIQPTSNYANVKFWGCEYWTAPRLDCVVEAFSGSYARGQKNLMSEGYFSAWHQPKIVISDILSINDQSYFNTGGYTMSEWMNSNKELYNLVQDNGISLILFSTHVTNTLLPSLASSVGIQGGYAFIDIAKKLTVSPPEESVVNTSDGLHLSNYGNAYYFAELERIFGPN